MKEFLGPTYFIESEHPAVKEFALEAAGNGDDIERAVKLYYSVRDSILYNPYCYTFEPEPFRASSVIEKGEGFCIQKSILLAALSRAAEIPCRLGFANVINHLSTKRIKELLRTDLFVFHGYNEFYLNEKWVKATPAFNTDLCEKFGLKPLEFNGSDDSIFHQYDREGSRHMEYVHDYGAFSDFPLDMMISESIHHYPHITELMNLKS